MAGNPTIDYDAIAESYATHREVSPAIVEHLIQQLSKHQIGSILEMGCGAADYLAVLVKRLKARGFGFDRCSQMLEQARRKNPGLPLACVDAEGAFPFHHDSFDLGFSVNLIHYLGHLRTFFAEAHRVVKPQGAVVTVTDSEEDVRRRTMSQYFPETVQIELQRYPSMAAICSAMEEVGWRQIKVTHTERTFALDSPAFERFQQKAYSALRLIPQACFEAGIARLRNDCDQGGAVVQELYTYVWARK